MDGRSRMRGMAAPAAAPSLCRFRLPTSPAGHLLKSTANTAIPPQNLSPPLSRPAPSCPLPWWARWERVSGHARVFLCRDAVWHRTADHRHHRRSRYRLDRRGPDPLCHQPHRAGDQRLRPRGRRRRSARPSKPARQPLAAQHPAPRTDQSRRRVAGDLADRGGARPAQLYGHRPGRPGRRRLSQGAGAGRADRHHGLGADREHPVSLGLRDRPQRHRLLPGDRRQQPARRARPQRRRGHRHQRHDPAGLRRSELSLRRLRHRPPDLQLSRRGQRRAETGQQHRRRRGAGDQRPQRPRGGRDRRALLPAGRRHRLLLYQRVRDRAGRRPDRHRSRGRRPHQPLPEPDRAGDRDGGRARLRDRRRRR